MAVGTCPGLALLLLHRPGLSGAGTKNCSAAVLLPWSLQLGIASGPGPRATLAGLLEALLRDGVGLWGLPAASPEALSRSPLRTRLDVDSPAQAWGTGWLRRCRLDGKPQEIHRATSPRQGVGPFMRSQAL